MVSNGRKFRAFILVPIALGIGFSQAPQPRAKPMEANETLTLLGTYGGPGASAERSGIASLITIDGHNYLIDAGEGVVRQLARVGIDARNVPTVFLTHLHDDHTAGLPALATFAYTLRSPTLTVVGPPRTQRMVDSLIGWIGSNAEIRGAEQPRKPPGAVIFSRDAGPGVIYTDDNLRVIAAENSHFHLPAGSPASRNVSYSLRFESKGRTIVFTGDSGPSEALEKLAENADILVCEMATEADLRTLPTDVVAHTLTEHLSPEEVGKLAAKAHVATVILSHVRNVSNSDLAIIRRHYSGRVILGRDLAKF